MTVTLEFCLDLGDDGIQLSDLQLPPVIHGNIAS